MTDPTGGWLTFIINQGVAIGVCAFLLFRLEARLSRVELLLQQLLDCQCGADATPAEVSARRARTAA